MGGFGKGKAIHGHDAVRYIKPLFRERAFFSFFGFACGHRPQLVTVTDHSSLRSQTTARGTWPWFVFSRPILAAGEPGIAAANSPDSFEHTANRAIFLNRQNHVCAARRLETAHRRQKRADALLVKEHQGDKQEGNAA